MKITIGADPEFFVAGKDGMPVSAFNMVPGNKIEPFKVEKGAVQVDGMALEININPSTNAKDFKTNLKSVMQELRTMVPPEYDFMMEPVAHFGKRYIQRQPEAAKVLGCEPDFNAYTQKENKPPEHSLPFRTAAGHVHIGWGECNFDQMHWEECFALTRQLDIALAIPSLLLDTSQDAVLRRQMYGAAGAFRPKPYGMEYRVLSNFWLKKAEYTDWVFRATKWATKALIDGRFLEEEYNVLPEVPRVRSVIDNNLVKVATHVIRTFELPVPKSLEKVL